MIAASLLALSVLIATYHYIDQQRPEVKNTKMLLTAVALGQRAMNRWKADPPYNPPPRPFLTYMAKCGAESRRYDSGKRKEHKPKLFGPDILRWGGGLPREGGGPKSSVCPSKPEKPNFFGGISRDFAGISRGRPKSLRKKGLCFGGSCRGAARGAQWLRVI